jgi:hypothetical protein
LKRRSPRRDFSFGVCAKVPSLGHDPEVTTFRGYDPLEIKNAGALSHSSERIEPSRGFEANLVSSQSG